MAFSYTLPVAAAGQAPNRGGSQVALSTTRLANLDFAVLPNGSLSPPLRPPSPGLGACALVGGLGGAPSCFAVLFPPFPPLRLVRCSRQSRGLRLKWFVHFGSSLRFCDWHKSIQNCLRVVLKSQQSNRQRQAAQNRQISNY